MPEIIEEYPHQVASTLDFQLVGRKMSDRIDLRRAVGVHVGGKSSIGDFGSHRAAFRLFFSRSRTARSKKVRGGISAKRRKIFASTPPVETGVDLLDCAGSAEIIRASVIYDSPF